MSRQRSKLDNRIRIPKPDDPVFRVHEYNVDLELNHIYLMGTDWRSIGESYELDEPGVEYSMANRFIRNINTCIRANPGKPILIHMKTNGGFWTEGMAIHDAIRTCGEYVTILNYTWARSMSSMIFCAANKRVMMPNSWFMFHEGMMSGDMTAKQWRSEMDVEEICLERMFNIYIDAVKRGGKMSSWSRTRIKEWIRDQMDKKEDVYLTPDQAMELGFADEIFSGNWASLTGYSADQKAVNRNYKP